MGFFPVHGSDVKAASRDTCCMKSACRPKQPAPTIGCRCSKSANSATKRLRDQREAAPKRYAVMKSPFDCLFPLMNGSPETCNVIHYQTIGKRKAGRHATLFIIKPSASEKSPSVIGPVSSTDGVCIGILRSEANSQQTEIDREIKMYFKK